MTGATPRHRVVWAAPGIRVDLQRPAEMDIALRKGNVDLGVCRTRH